MNCTCGQPVKPGRVTCGRTECISRVKSEAGKRGKDYWNRIMASVSPSPEPRN